MKQTASQKWRQNFKKHNGECTPWKTVTGTEKEIKDVIKMSATQRNRCRFSYNIVIR